MSNILQQQGLLITDEIQARDIEIKYRILQNFGSAYTMESIDSMSYYDMVSLAFCTRYEANAAIFRQKKMEAKAREEAREIDLVRKMKKSGR